MLIQGQVGPTSTQSVSAGSTPPMRLGQQGDVIVTELHGRYYEQAYRGNMFTTSVPTAAAVTAYSGGAGGTPMIALYNPAGSNKNAVILQSSIANVVAASAAGTVTFGLYYGQTAAITAALTAAQQPYSMLTQRQSGSAMYTFVNSAITSSTAATAVLPLSTYYWATAAGAFMVPPAIVDHNGSIIIPPGAYVALGGSAALTSATWIGSLTWEEVPL